MYFYKREGIKGLAYYAAKILLHSGRILLKAPNKKGERLKIVFSNAIKGISFNPAVEYPKQGNQQ